MARLLPSSYCGQRPFSSACQPQTPASARCPTAGAVVQTRASASPASPLSQRSAPLSGSGAEPGSEAAAALLGRPSSSRGELTDCCSSGHCSHSRSRSSSCGMAGMRWPIPRLLLTGAALAAPLSAAASHAAEEVGTAAVSAAGAAAAIGISAAELAAAGVTTVVPAGYVPSPVEPGWEIWLGFVAGVVPFMIGSYEFGKRIIIQLRCEVCGGRGLVPSAGAGKYLRKCPQCGGFFPWISWKMFLSSTAAPGNGGPLMQPRGQTSVLYSVPGQPDADKQAEALARSQAAIDALLARGQRADSTGGGTEVAADGSVAVGSSGGEAVVPQGQQVASETRTSAGSSSEGR